MDMMSHDEATAAAQLLAHGKIDTGIRIQTLYHVECWRRGTLLWEEDFHNIVVTAGLNHILTCVIRGATAPNNFNTGVYNDGRVVPRRWATGQTIAAGDVCRPTDAAAGGSIGRLFIATVGGTTHASTEPTWPTTAGGTVTDNTVTWLEASRWYIGLITGGASAPVAGDTMASHSGWTEFANYSESARQAYVPGTVAAGSCDNTGNEGTFTISSDTQSVYGAFLCDLPTKSGTAGLLYGAGQFTGGTRSGLMTNDTLKVKVTTSAT